MDGAARAPAMDGGEPREQAALRGARSHRRVLSTEPWDD
jgi:hypothetical protein